MSRLSLRWFLLTLLGPAMPLCTAQTVQLADGRVLLAEVEPGSASGEGLRVKRLDNGGTLDLRWDHLSPASALELKKRFDLAGDAQEELKMTATAVEYRVNGQKQTLIGVRVESLDTPEHLMLEVKGVQYKVPRAEVSYLRKVEAPVTQVLTKNAFAEERRNALNPGNDADKWILFAEDMMKVRDFDHAGEGLDKAKELGNSKNPQHLEALLARLQRFKESAQELKFLEDIRTARNRAQAADFDKGTKLIAQFESKFPATKLKAEFELEKRRFGEARTRYYTSQVAETWRRSIALVAEKTVTDPATTLQSAKDYAQNKMTDDIVARVAATLKLDANEVKQLWGERKNNAVGKRTETFSYGVGSWVLGDEAILKGTATGKEIDKQKKDQEPTNPNSKEMERFQKLLKQALDRRRQAVQGQDGEKKEQTDEDWWRQADRGEKISWLRAFYAEFGGQLVVTYATVSPCISCYGEGTVPEISGDGKMVRNKCFLCQSTKWLRSFRAY